MANYYQPEIETASREKILAWQNERLVKQVQHVWDNVPYYRAKMEEKGLTPDDIKGVDDLHKLPFLSKADLRDAYPYGLMGKPKSECVRIHSTSGTTGKRVMAFYTQHDIDLWEDCCARAIVAAGGTKEDVLHVFLVANIKDYRLCISKINTFLPYVDNWGVCDSLRPKCFAKHKTELLGEINQWLSSPHPYTIRFAIEMLMVHFLDEDFSDEYLDYVATVKSNDYYVKMMVAWCFATALSKQYDTALPYLENNVLPTWTHNKTIQKSVESYRLDEEQKSYLRTLKQHY